MTLNYKSGHDGFQHASARDAMALQTRKAIETMRDGSPRGGFVRNLQAPARICGWCGIQIAPGVQPATYGICAKCFVRMERDPKRPQKRPDPRDTAATV